MTKDRLSRSRPARRGFTLIEMLTVIAIIIVLAGILLPAIAGMVNRARIAATRAQIANISQACLMYENDFGFYPPDTLKDTPAANQGYSDGDKPAEALWFFLTRKFTYKLTETNFNSGPGVTTTYNFTQPTVFATKNVGAYFSVQSGQVKDYDNDNVPELLDVWKQPLFYNAPGGASGEPLHNPQSFDLFSVGPNGATRQADKTYTFTNKVLNGAPADYAAWITWCFGAAAGGNDTSGEGGNALIAGSYTEKHQDDINNWNTK